MRLLGERHPSQMGFLGRQKACSYSVTLFPVLILNPRHQSLHLCHRANISVICQSFLPPKSFPILQQAIHVHEYLFDKSATKSLVPTALTILALVHLLVLAAVSKVGEKALPKH